jgi:hypothetical protein
MGPAARRVAQEPSPPPRPDTGAPTPRASRSLQRNTVFARAPHRAAPAAVVREASTARDDQPAAFAVGMPGAGVARADGPAARTVAQSQSVFARAPHRAPPGAPALSIAPRRGRRSAVAFAFAMPGPGVGVRMGQRHDRSRRKHRHRPVRIQAHPTLAARRPFRSFSVAFLEARSEGEIQRLNGEDTGGSRKEWRFYFNTPPARGGERRNRGCPCAKFSRETETPRDRGRPSGTSPCALTAIVGPLCGLLLPVEQIDANMMECAGFRNVQCRPNPQTQFKERTHRVRRDCQMDRPFASAAARRARRGEAPQRQSSIAARTRSATSAAVAFQSNGTEISTAGYDVVCTANFGRSG